MFFVPFLCTLRRRSAEVPKIPCRGRLRGAGTRAHVRARGAGDSNRCWGNKNGPLLHGPLAGCLGTDTVGPTKG